MGAEKVVCPLENPLLRNECQGSYPFEGRRGYYGATAPLLRLVREGATKLKNGHVILPRPVDGIQLNTVLKECSFHTHPGGNQ